MNRNSSFQQINLPALTNGEISQIKLSSFQGYWTVICLPPKLSLVEALFLEQQSLLFTREGAEFVVLLLNSIPFPQPWESTTPKLRYPLVADSLGKVAKIFGLSQLNNPAKSQSLILDEKGFLRCHLIHEFNGRGMVFVAEMLRHYRSHPAAVGVSLDQHRSSKGEIPGKNFKNQKTSGAIQPGGRTHEKRRQSERVSTHQIAGL